MGSYDMRLCVKEMVNLWWLIDESSKWKAGETIAHLYRPGLDGRPTYAHGEENPLEVFNLEENYSLIII